MHFFLFLSQYQIAGNIFQSEYYMKTTLNVDHFALECKLTLRKYNANIRDD